MSANIRDEFGKITNRPAAEHIAPHKSKTTVYLKSIEAGVGAFLSKNPNDGSPLTRSRLFRGEGRPPIHFSAGLAERACLENFKSSLRTGSPVTETIQPKISQRVPSVI